METNTIIFMGPQGSGKGTQVELLKGRFEEDGKSVIHLQTGQPFRDMMERGSFTADRVKALMNSGQLVPDWLTDALVARELEEKLTEETVMILDGYPRNLAQASVLEDMLAFYGRSQLAVVYLDTPEEVVKERMLCRGRSDDTEEAIEQRLSLYKEMTEPVVQYYKERKGTNMIIVDGGATIEAVQGDVIAKLDDE